MAIGVFRPNRGKPLEQRIRDIEQHLAQLSLDPETVQQILAGGGFGGGGGGGGGSSIRLPLPESQVKWDPTSGHMHDGTDAEGAKISHANLDPATVTPDQHHAQVHVLASTTGLGADHTVTGLTSGQVLKATGPDTARFQALGHHELDPGSITADQHHAQVHALASPSGLGADHTVSGLTANQVLKATGSTTARFELLGHDELDPASITADQHHAQQHVLATTAGLGSDHTVAGLTANQVLKATGPSSARFELLGHDELDAASISPDQHHAQVHTLASTSGLGADHTVSGLTANQVLKATGSTTARFELLGHDDLDPATIGEDDHHDRAHVLLGNSDHSDTTIVGEPATGDLIYRNGASFWTRLGIGSTGNILRVVSGVPAWVAHTFANLPDSISAAQHGNLTSTAESTADHSGTLSANARVAVRVNSDADPGKTYRRRRLNFIEGSNVTIDVAEDVGEEEIDITISQASVSAATIIVQEGDATVDAAASTLDFAAGDFNVTSSPAGEANIAWHGFTVQENDSDVDTACKILDFNGSDFNVTSSPSGEANIAWQGMAVEAGDVAVAADVKTLDFGAGFDVTASGGEAEISLDLSEVVTGDVSFSGNAATVDRLKGKTLPTPASGDDGKVLRYDHANGEFDFVTLNPVATSGAPVFVGAWAHAGINAFSAGSPAGPIPCALNPGNANPIVQRLRTGYAGHLTKVVLDIGGDLGGGATSLTATVYVNDIAAGLTATITGGAGTEDYALGTGSVAVSETDNVSIYLTRTGGTNNRHAVVRVYMTPS